MISRLGVPMTSLFAIAACVSDNTLAKKPVEKEEFDTSSEWEAPETDTSDDVTEDTGGSSTVAKTCDGVLSPSDGWEIAETIECEPEPTTPDWTLRQVWNDKLSTMLSTVAIANLNDDNGNGVIDDGDYADVVATPYSGQVIAYDGAANDGTRLWTASSSHIEQTTVAIGDLDGDGFPEVVVAGLYGSLALHGEDGSHFWNGAAPDSIKAYCGSIGIADLDADGDPEVFSGRRILNGQTGATVGTGGYGHGSATSGHSPNSIAADLDLDGIQEVIVGNAAYTKNGSAKFTTGRNDGFPAVANFDSDDEGEIVVASQGMLRLIDTDGSQVWETSMSSTGYTGPPAIADFDGDGEPEIAVPVAPGVMVFDTDGTQLWHWKGYSSSYFDGVSAYDLDGDDDWEVLHVGNDGLHILDGRDGSLLSTLSGAQTYCGQMPVVADLENDGHVDMAFGTYQNGVFVMEDDADNFIPGLNIWNQHSFSITNIDTDGKVPEVPDTNWLNGYNSFRAGPPIEKVFPNKNLQATIEDICAEELCNHGNLEIEYRVGNSGTQDVDEDFTVEILGTTVKAGTSVLYSTTWTGGAPAAWMSQSIVIELTKVPPDLIGLEIRVDGESAEYGTIGECDETDNAMSVRWDTPCEK